jgi:spermidine synthase
MHRILLFAVFVVATCGIIYELVCGTVASYLLGDSVFQFSTIIGAYLFSMGIGSWFSRYFKINLIMWFIQVELLVGLIGGITPICLFFLFSTTNSFQIFLYLFVGLTGTLVGLEIPLLLKILKDRIEFGDLISKVFTVDYVGALFASIVFPMFLIPYLGLTKTALFFGMLNTSVGIYVCYSISDRIPWSKYLRIQGWAILFFLLITFVYASKIESYTESLAFNEPIIYSKSSSYQRIVITSKKGQLRLYLNGNLQFNSVDEYRYHESLVHPAMSEVMHPENILVLGGGDGLALREIYKYPSVKSVMLVDLDSTITNLFKFNKMLSEINGNALNDARTEIVNQDAFQWISNQRHNFFDVIIVDFPDPTAYSLGKLYTDRFYKELLRVLNEDGRIVVQSTSPFVAPNSFWCVNNTLKSVGFKTLPYHTYVPSFGDWGYVMAGLNQPSNNPPIIKSLKFINSKVFNSMCIFPTDMDYRDTEINKLNNQKLVRYFEEEWSKIN